MEEADARLQEVVASLLNEHGGSHEQALRQTFACLHNSGLYEAQSAAEEEQREQQVLAVFRSFPFRTPAAPEGNGAGSLVEETQAPPPPPPAYNNALAREPEEAGEVTPAQVDPENVGEDAGAQPAPEALLPLNPVEPQPADPQPSLAPPGPEVSHQGAAPPSNLPPHQPPTGEDAAPTQGSATPESFASAALDTGDAVVAPAAAVAVAVGLSAAAAAAAAAGGGVEETKGEEWGEGIVYPETGEAEEGLPVAVEEGAAGASTEESGSQLEAGGQQEETGNGATGAHGESTYGCNGTAASETNEGVVYSDPESTRQEGSTASQQQEPPPQREQEAARTPQVNGSPPTATAAAAAAAVGEAAGGARNMDAPARPADAGDGGAAASATVPAPAAGTAGAAAAVSAPTTTAVTEPHLKTAGQPLTHANRAESPTGMSTDLQDKLKALKLRRKHRFVTMRIEGTEVVAETVAAPAEGPAELKAALPYSDCRYAVYDQAIVTADGRKANKLFFFTWVPHNATPHNKMAYSHGKVTVRQRLEGLYDVAASSSGDVKVSLGLVDEDEEESDIDF
ncbi:unnamed protein product [Ectocarpus sp. 12 AP-2014]